MQAKKVRPSLGGSAETIFEAFRKLSVEACGLRITEAEIVGAGERYRLDKGGKLLRVVGEVGVIDATKAETREFFEAIELGQVQIYQTPLWVSGRTMRRTVLHQATGIPLDPDSPAARRQQCRFAQAVQAKGIG